MPPKLRITSKFYHPNVHEDGLVCISILHAPGQDQYGYEASSERWLPIHTVESILLSVISMISTPNPDSPANVDAAVRARALRAHARSEKRARGQQRAMMHELSTSHLLACSLSRAEIASRGPGRLQEGSGPLRAAIARGVICHRTSQLPLLHLHRRLPLPGALPRRRRDISIFERGCVHFGSRVALSRLTTADTAR